MTHMSLQNMNGVGSLMRRRISPNHRTTLSAFGDAGDTMPDDLGLDPQGLRPNYGTDWIQPPLKKDEVTTQRGTPTPGETRKAYSADRPSFPMTPSNDARDLTNSFTGRPMSRMARRDFTTQFPHTWMPYEELKAATGPEMGPTPPGWAPIPTAAQLRRRSQETDIPVPWVAEDHMTHDISGLRGFASIHDIPGMVVSLDDPGVQAAAGAVQKQADAAKAAGASPDVVNQVIDVAAKAAALALQARAGTMGPVSPKPATSSILPSFLTSGNNTPLYVAGGLTLAAALALAIRAGRKGGRRR